MFIRIFDFFSPRYSLLGSEGSLITERERRLLLAAEPAVLERPMLRKMGIASLDRVVAGARYASHPVLRSAIHAFKYRGVRFLVDDLSALLLRSAPRMDKLPRPILVPVPLHWSRRFTRGFNQAELLARIVGLERGWEVRSLLRRVRPTGHQAWRTHRDRRFAVSGAFRITNVSRCWLACCSKFHRETSMVDGASNVPFVILVDDLMTTGATLSACAKELRRAGVRRIEGWVVALG